MPNKFKSIQKYICKIKTPRSFSSILSGCKHPRTASLAVERSSKDVDHHGEKQKKDEAATLYDIDQFLLENFRSLYIGNAEENQDRQKHDDNKGDEKKKLDIPSETFGSHRFFVPIGPSSSSLMEEARLSFGRCSDEGGGEVRRSSSTSAATTAAAGDYEFRIRGGDDDNGGGDDDNDGDDENSHEDTDGDCVNDEYMTIKTYSWNPYNDFLVSMQEMIEAKLEEDGKIDWEFMEELLVCYLSLNEKKSHKFIISAFVDLVVSLRQPSSERLNIRRLRGQRKKLAGIAREIMEGKKKLRN